MIPYSKSKYIQIIANNVPPSKKKLGGKLILQHDNCPVHTSTDAQFFLTNKKIGVLKDWPSCSPDLNPIEHIWAKMKHQLAGTMHKNVEDLKKKCKGCLVPNYPRLLPEARKKYAE
eukprot:Platyproteum_vivax@DN10690_c0_g1_i1.p2